jgi:PAS domain-containing protein
LSAARDGTIEHLIAHLQDITARKKAEEERVRLAAAIENAAELVIITDRTGHDPVREPGVRENHRIQPVKMSLGQQSPYSQFRQA